MRELMPAPCEHFDVEQNFCKHSCPDMVEGIAEAQNCGYYQSSLTPEDIENDPHGPCKRRRTEYADNLTVDMFGDLA